jgi:hypothetical protein
MKDEVCADDREYWPARPLAPRQANTNVLLHDTFVLATSGYTVGR